MDSLIGNIRVSFCIAICFNGNELKEVIRLWVGRGIWILETQVELRSGSRGKRQLSFSYNIYLFRTDQRTGHQSCTSVAPAAIEWRLQFHTNHTQVNVLNLPPEIANGGWPRPVIRDTIMGTVIRRQPLRKKHVHIRGSSQQQHAEEGDGETSYWGFKFAHIQFANTYMGFCCIFLAKLKASQIKI